jgi:hypothetical protein
MGGVLTEAEGKFKSAHHHDASDTLFGLIGSAAVGQQHSLSAGFERIGV